MTPTPAWYEADADDSDRNVTDDITASTQQEPRGAILEASEPARGFSDADLLRRRTEALERVRLSRDEWRERAEAAEAEVVRLQEDDHEKALLVGRLATIVRDVEALADEWTQGAWASVLPNGDYMAVMKVGVAQDVGDWLRERLDAVLARSQAPQAPAEQVGGNQRLACAHGGHQWVQDEGVSGAGYLKRCESCGAAYATSRHEWRALPAPSPRPATADDEGVQP